ncbi:MAG: prepilin-type N-terminal cleavage/methylation domain-containing protein [Gammaproteobacteria bacterium]
MLSAGPKIGFQKRESGFTLIELIMVLILVGILFILNPIHKHK